MRWTSIASSLLLACSLSACGGSRLDAHTAERLAVARAARTPSYWLGTKYDGLKLVHVDSGADAFFASELYYADCSWLDVNSLSPKCHRVIEVDNDASAPGEISTMGRCIFSTRINGVTVATFPVNPGDLRVFAQSATPMVSSEKRAWSLEAIAALKPLNGHPLAHRDVSTALGTCKAPPPKPPVHLTARQRYARRMKLAFAVAQSGGINLNAVDPTAARPKAVLEEFLAGSANVAPLLRNVADRTAKIAPPPDAAAPEAQLVTAMRHSADVVDEVRSDAKRDGLDERAWSADRRDLRPKLGAAAAQVQRALRAYRAHGYSTYVKPSD
ncbi:MAG TPA: hypothetical protein VI408_11840 [Gaiellaceae bacterium]